MAENKPSQVQPKPAQPQAEISIVRIAGKDINGSNSVINALRQVKGISHNLANAIAIVSEKKFGIGKGTRVGSLDEEKLSKLEQVMKDPVKFGVPPFMLNRQRDLETGRDMHLVGTDLVIMVKQDIDNAVKMQTWIGFRHKFGQKVRGQHTRSTGRTGETVGVTKKRVLEAAKQARTAEGAAKPKEEKK